MLNRLEVLMTELSTAWRCQLIEFGGESDHVHLLVDAHPSMNLACFIGNLKSVTARKMRTEFAQHLLHFYWKPLFWNNAYAVVSVGGHTNIEQLLTYIQSQETPK
jgi:putative transposase